MVKEIVVISGKGGTGKTSVTAALAYLGGKDVVTADCDVDAADMHLLMNPDFACANDFYSGVIADIDQECCVGCGKCAQVCRFNAINVVEGAYSVDKVDCEGCGYCARICGARAITMVEQKVGEYFISTTRTGSRMVHARLGIGAENSGKLVTRVKNEAKRIAVETSTQVVLVDGSPGIGCPVVSSLSGADFVVFVTEPTVSGLHDLKRVLELVNQFGIRSGGIINKADLNPKIAEEIRTFFGRNDISHLGELPYDEAFSDAMTSGRTIVEHEASDLTDVLVECWRNIKQIVAA
jgi:MinD superfamily P-loop ATPase